MTKKIDKISESKTDLKSVKVKDKSDVKSFEESDFTKEKLLTFERYKNRRDLLTALLDDDRRYTIKEADEAIENFMKGGVK